MCPNGHVKINFWHPAKLLQEILLKTKLRKFPQKCPTLEKIVISTPECVLCNKASSLLKFDTNGMAFAISLIWHHTNKQTHITHRPID